MVVFAHLCRHVGSLYSQIERLLFFPTFFTCIDAWYILLDERAIARGKPKVCTRSSALAQLQPRFGYKLLRIRVSVCSC